MPAQVSAGSSWLRRAAIPVAEDCPVALARSNAIGDARLLVEVGDITRFPDRDHFASWNGTAPLDASSGDIRRFPNQEHNASYAGTAPIDVSSGDQETHRLSRRGNRQLNAAIHLAAVTQARDPGPGRDHYRRKSAETMPESGRAPRPSVVARSTTTLVLCSCRSGRET
jgi:transposase